MDWSDYKSLLEVCKNVDVVIHAAGMNAKECMENPELAMQVNGIATENLVNAASKQLVSKFIFISSAHVYKDDLNGVISEKTNITNMHPYATSQVAGEIATMKGHSNIAMQTSVVRLANAIGAPLTKDVNCWMLLVNDLCKQATLDRRMVIQGPLSGARNFITMTDVCLGLEFLIANLHDRVSPLVCNLGDKTKTIGDIAFAIKSIYLKEKGIDLEMIELSSDLSTTQYLDFRSSILADLGFQWSSNFKEEIVKLIQFCEFEFGVLNAN
jgi:UDP-glucose 4-epimerase